MAGGVASHNDTCGNIARRHFGKINGNDINLGLVNLSTVDTCWKIDQQETRNILGTPNTDVVSEKKHLWCHFAPPPVFETDRSQNVALFPPLWRVFAWNCVHRSRRTKLATGEKKKGALFGLPTFQAPSSGIPPSHLPPPLP